MRRVLLLIAFLVCAELGCAGRRVEASDGGDRSDSRAADLLPPDHRPIPPSGVDLLFVIDDSASTLQYQLNLIGLALGGCGGSAQGFGAGDLLPVAVAATRSSLPLTERSSSERR